MPQTTLNQTTEPTMACPRTGAPMRRIEVDGIAVDVSEGCGGLWFDRFEIDKFDDAGEPHGRTLLAMIEGMQKEVDTRPRLQSPKAAGVTMMRRRFSPAHTVVIDECPATGGIWLDPGELATIRQMFDSAADRQVAEDAFMSDLKNAFVDEVGEAVAETKATRWSNLVAWFTGQPGGARRAA